MKLTLSALTSILFLFGGFTALIIGTSSGKAWTTESARRLDIQSNPKPLINTVLSSSNNTQVSMLGYSKPLMLVDFIYTKCPTVCIGLGLEFKQIQSDLVASGYDSNVQLLSVSFDLVNDTPSQLKSYLRYYNANKELWDAAVFQTEQDKTRTLDEFGIIVIPDEKVGFIHNTATYMVYEGKIIGIFDLNDREKILDKIASILN